MSEKIEPALSNEDSLTPTRGRLRESGCVGLRARASGYRDTAASLQLSSFKDDAEFFDRIADALESYLPPI